MQREKTSSFTSQKIVPEPVGYPPGRLKLTVRGRHITTGFVGDRGRAGWGEELTLDREHGLAPGKDMWPQLSKHLILFFN